MTCGNRCLLMDKAWRIQLHQPVCNCHCTQWTHLARAPSGQPYPATKEQPLHNSSNVRFQSAHRIGEDGSSSLPLAPCQQQLLQQAQSVLEACPGLPGFCPRPKNVQTAQKVTYLRPGGPQNGQMAQQKKAVDEFLAGPGFQERVSKLQQLQDKQGILISAGKPHHVGNAAIILHVSPPGVPVLLQNCFLTSSTDSSW